MKEYYQIKRNLIIQNNRILSRLVVYKKAYDISRKRLHPRPTPTTQQNHKKKQIIGSKYFLSYLLTYFKSIICFYSFI